MKQMGCNVFFLMLPFEEVRDLYEFYTMNLDFYKMPQSCVVAPNITINETINMIVNVTA